MRTLSVTALKTSPAAASHPTAAAIMHATSSACATTDIWSPLPGTHTGRPRTRRSKKYSSQSLLLPYPVKYCGRNERSVAVQVAFETQSLKPGNHFDTFKGLRKTRRFHFKLWVDLIQLVQPPPPHRHPGQRLQHRLHLEVRVDGSLRWSVSVSVECRRRKKNGIKTTLFKYYRREE
jgi:hypothetical protein